METGEKGITTLPESNVLYYALENDEWCCVRPSGTEPLVRVMLEGKEEGQIRELATNLANLIQEKLS